MNAKHLLTTIFRSSSRIARFLGFFGMGVLALINSGAPWLPVYGQFILLISSITLLILGLGAVSWQNLPVGITRSTLKTSAPLFAIMGIGLALRLWNLDGAVHFFIDELHFAKGVSYLRADVPLLAPSVGHDAYPWIFTYMQSIGVSLFGHTLLGLRIVSALIGTLTIPALYLLAEAFFDRPTALLAALLLATFPPHVHFSRIGLNNIGDALFGTLALAFLARGLRNGKPVEYTIAGVSLGLTQYFHETGRLLFPVLIAVWLVGWWVHHYRSDKHPPTRQTCIFFALAALAVGAPIYTTLLARHLPLTTRLSAEVVGIDFWKSLLASSGDSVMLHSYLRHLADSFLAYTATQDIGMLYGGSYGFILPPLVPAFIVGLGAAIWRSRLAGSLLILWLTLIALGSSLLRDSPLAARYVVTFPALALLLAIGFRSLPRRFQRIGAVLAVGAAVLQTVYYFGFHLEIYNRQIRLYPDGQDAIFRALHLPIATQVHVIGISPLYVPEVADMLRFFGREDLQVHIWKPHDFTDSVIAHLPHNIDQVFFIKPEDERTRQQIEAYFRLEPPVFSPYNVPTDKQYALYFSPRPPLDQIEKTPVP